MEAFLSTPSARRATRAEAFRYSQIRYFYPRPPRGGRPIWWTSTAAWSWISIHALREEGDPADFSVGLDADGFLSTPSARRATSSRNDAQRGY